MGIVVIASLGLTPLLKADEPQRDGKISEKLKTKDQDAVGILTGIARLTEPDLSYAAHDPANGSVTT